MRLYEVLEADAGVKGLTKSELIRSIIVFYYDNRSVLSERLKQTLREAGYATSQSGVD